jgi:hypothetical protein
MLGYATVGDKSRAEPRILTKHFYRSPTTAPHTPLTKPSDPRFVTAASYLSCPRHRQRLLWLTDDKMPAGNTKNAVGKIEETVGNEPASSRCRRLAGNVKPGARSRTSKPGPKATLAVRWVPSRAPSRISPDCSQAIPLRRFLVRAWFPTPTLSSELRYLSILGPKGPH